jgi:hypothetical protein
MQQGACTANNFGPSLEGVFLFFTLSVKSQYMKGTRLRMSLCISAATGVKKIPFCEVRRPNLAAAMKKLFSFEFDLSRLRHRKCVNFYPHVFLHFLNPH